ncbi:MAG: glutamate-5-semialdehyde dehydrogenase [Candidatus Aureabacteria bacterium]|nr:glutamate-5-semialdehyde dehydrogenase [Candidatus Auribacterota bacterium]
MTTSTQIKGYVEEIGRRARAAASVLANAPTSVKNGALLAMAQSVEKEASSLIAANRVDLQAAEKAGIGASVRQRLAITEKTIREMSEGLRQVVSLADPVGEVLGEWDRPNGLKIRKVRVPIGVIAMIYEARPNVTADAAALCIKSGNAVILRGGREALNSNIALSRLLQRAAANAGLPEAALQLIERVEHRVVSELLTLNAYIDLVIPRGGEELIRKVAEISTIPVIKHYKGVCHVYVDMAADLSMAESIVLNAKVQKPAVCNAAEALLIHEGIARSFLPRIAARLREKGVELRGDPGARAIVPDMKTATEKDWGCEFLDLILAVRVVKDMDEAIAYIARYGSHHSDAIVTSDKIAAERFLREVDSSAVFWNASTRFNDGGQFGMGAEIGISTDRIHARGPMALPELTIYKYVVTGSGQVRE